MGLQWGLDCGVVCELIKLFELCTVERRMGGEGAAPVVMFGVGGDSPPEFNTLMSLTHGPSHVLAQTWPTYQRQRQSVVQYTYVGQCSSLARCGHAIGPVLWDADRVGIYPFNLELKFVTGISPSYLIQI